MALSKLKALEIILGFGLGLGYMTKLRFFGLVGISEILILISLLILYRNHGRGLFSFENKLSGYIKIYMLFSVMIILPITSIIVNFLTSYNSNLNYIISYNMGVVLAFLIVEGLRSKRLNMSHVTFWFSFSYIVSNAIAILLFSTTTGSGRYTGFAENPNQLMFYASSLSLLLVIYRSKLAFFVVPVIMWITMKTGSDAYILSITVIFFVYIWLYFLFNKKIPFYISVILSVTIAIFILIFSLYNYFDELVGLWSTADEGGTRLDLMWHALEVTLTSPFTGYGAGSFSGIETSFLNREAHNTFLDFSMQFGLIFPMIIYLVTFLFLWNRIVQKYYIHAAFVAAFIVSSIFHFNGRHFFFWMEFAIFYHYAFYLDKNTMFDKSNNHKNLIIRY